MTKSVGDDFQKETKYSRKMHLANYLDWANKPDTYKNYPKAQKIQLSKKFPEKTLDIVEILKIVRVLGLFLPRRCLLLIYRFFYGHQQAFKENQNIMNFAQPHLLVRYTQLKRMLLRIW